KHLKSKWGQMELIVDSAGSDQWNALLDLLKPGCKLVFYGATLGHPSALHLHKIFWKQLAIQGSTMGSPQDFANMLEFVKSKKLIPTVDSIRSFSEIISAFDQMKKGQQFGKLVVKF
ncbi:MAG: alcohol dehydrogenase, partial [Bacteroidetes bacterium SW_10_40_5]